MEMGTMTIIRGLRELEEEFNIWRLLHRWEKDRGLLLEQDEKNFISGPFLFQNSLVLHQLTTNRP